MTTITFEGTKYDLDKARAPLKATARMAKGTKPQQTYAKARLALSLPKAKGWARLHDAVAKGDADTIARIAEHGLKAGVVVLAERKAAKTAKPKAKAPTRKAKPALDTSAFDGLTSDQMEMVAAFARMFAK